MSQFNAEDSFPGRMAGFDRTLKPLDLRPIETTALNIATVASGECVAPSGVFAPARVRDSEEGELMRRLCELGDFVRRLRRQARFGELSRAPLKLLRVQVCGDTAECDWIARPPDPWDANLPSMVGKRNASLQALNDAVRVRELLFSIIPSLYKAVIKIYRLSDSQSLELIVTGTVSKEERAPATVRSPAMRAKLFGFRFWLDEGILETLEPEVNGAISSSSTHAEADMEVW